MGTGLAKSTCCQPEAVSPVKVTVPKRVPLVVQRSPICVPVLALALKNRIEVINPATSERNFTPSSTGESGPPSTVPGAVEPGQMVKVDTMGMVILSGAVVVSVG